MNPNTRVKMKQWNPWEETLRIQVRGKTIKYDSDTDRWFIHFDDGYKGWIRAKSLEVI